jgi:serine protease
LLGSAEAQLFRQQLANETNRIIVKYRQPTMGSAAVSAISQQVMQVTGHDISHTGRTGVGAQIFTLDASLPLDEVEAVVNQIELRSDVEYAEADKWVFPFYTPSDPRYNEQWHYYESPGSVRLPEAWDSTSGEDVIVAVVDSGYTEHEDLLDNLQLPGADLIFETNISNDGDGRDQNALDPGDWSPDCGWNESTWHGTHTAGTVAAVADNDIGVVGVAFNAKVLPVRVLGTCGGWMTDIADGITWAAGGTLHDMPVNQTPAQVINVSTGALSSGCSNYTQQAIDTARQLGSTVITAAGNYSSDVSGIEPANCNGIIAVAATDRFGNRASFSNYGDMVDIAAPGVSILSTSNTGATFPEGDTYEYFQGTSMATPLVSGVTALLYSIRPDITPTEVEQILTQSARAFPGTCDGCGAGLLDAAAAVAATIETIPDPDPEPDLVILENGVAQEGLAGATDDSLLFAIDVPATANSLRFVISGGSGDADLYVSFASEPTLSSYDCRPYLTGNAETCAISNIQEGRYFVMIHGYTDFSDLSLVASYTESSTPDPDSGRFENMDDYQIPGFSYSGVGSPIDVSLTDDRDTVDVHVEIIHPYMREVFIALTTPDGQIFWLSAGVSGENLNQTYTIALGDIPMAGRWTLWAIDFGFSGQGYIDGWSLTFN